MDASRVLPCLCALLLLLGAAQAQEPKHCVSPPLMSGSFSFMGPDGLFTSYGTITYDNFSQRSRLQYSGFNNGSFVNLEVLMLFKEKVYYEINWNRLSCKKRALDDTFVPMQVPSDAKLMGQAILGSSSSWGMGVLVNTWVGALPGNGTYSAVFTEVGCIPLTYTGYAPSTGWTTLSTFNWVLGTLNPMHFIPPAICAKDKADEAEAPSSFFKVLENFARNVKSEESN